MTPEPVRVAVLLSGRGSNMVALAEHRRLDPERAYRIALVASNVPTARGLVAAQRLNLPTWARSHRELVREEFDALVEGALIEHRVELVALAGYMRVLSTGFVERWRGRVLNVHPSLLPLYKGLNTHQRAIDAGDADAGCSVHIVTPQLDDGLVIAQARVAIRLRDTAATLEERVRREEHRLYPAALDAYAAALRDGLIDAATRLHAS